MSDLPDILVVCTANVCRSPLIEYLLRQQLHAGYVIGSAGVSGWRDAPIDTDSGAQLLARGIDPATFRSRRLRARHLLAADLVLTATMAHRSDTVSLAPSTLRRTFTLLELADLVTRLDLTDVTDLDELTALAASYRFSSTVPRDVADPYRQGTEVHRRTAATIEAAVDALSPVLNAMRPPPQEVVPSGR